MTVNPHAWALILALGMQGGGLGGGIASAWAMFYDKTPGWQWHHRWLAFFVIVTLLGFIPLAIWFHYNPCPAGCR